MAGARCLQFCFNEPKSSVTLWCERPAAGERSPLVQDLRRRWDVVPRAVLQHCRRHILAFLAAVVVIQQQRMEAQAAREGAGGRLQLVAYLVMSECITRALDGH